jgi:hypothetical protein
MGLCVCELTATDLRMVLIHERVKFPFNEAPTEVHTVA